MPSARVLVNQSGLRGPKGDQGIPGTGGGGGGGGATDVAAVTHAATAKTTPVNADEFPLVDSASGNTLAKLTWQQLVARVKAAFGASDVGLGSVNNTADSAKPVSTAQQAALDLKQNIATLQSDIDAVFVGINIKWGYNTGTSSWPTIPTALATDANISWDFVGGDVSHAPPSVSGTVRTWHRNQ